MQRNFVYLMVAAIGLLTACDDVETISTAYRDGVNVVEVDIQGRDLALQIDRVHFDMTPDIFYPSGAVLSRPIRDDVVLVRVDVTAINNSDAPLRFGYEVMTLFDGSNGSPYRSNPWNLTRSGITSDTIAMAAGERRPVSFFYVVTDRTDEHKQIESFYLSAGVNRVEL